MPTGSQRLNKNKQTETFDKKWVEFQEWLKKCPVEWDDTNESESLVETYKFFFNEYDLEE